MNKILLPPEAPTWFVRVMGEIEKAFVPVSPKSPVKLPSYDSSSIAGLPDPKKYSGALIWISNLSTVAVSDGTDWYPIDLGAPI